MRGVPLPLRTVRVDVQGLWGLGVAQVAQLKIDTLDSRGVVTRSVPCSDASTCSDTVPDGVRVQITAGGDR